ncbi:Heparin sulfate O-sulfotransferase [Aphelenchoides fujianensis]|nr:Heparin sulfate O-sulfotransferase [Aphelenchoides fujianensis]
MKSRAAFYSFLLFGAFCSDFTSSTDDFSLESKQSSGGRQTGRFRLARDVVLYNRIPKTGSTTFTNAVAYDLYRLNGFHALHINTTKNNFLLNVVDQAEFVRNVSFWTAVRPAFYHGHLAFVDFNKFGFPNPLYINIVREPLERFVSYFYFLQHGDDYRVGLNRSRAGRNETFDHCFKRRGRDCDPADKMWLQIPYFCGTSSFCKKPGSLEALEAAKRNLVDHYLVEMIVVLERLLPDFFRGASSHFEELESAEGECPFIRSSCGRKAHLRSTTKKVDLQPETLDRLKEHPIYRLEREFYDFAVQEFDSLADRLKAADGTFLPRQFRYEKIKP